MVAAGTRVIPATGSHHHFSTPLLLRWGSRAVQQHRQKSPGNTSSWWGTGTQRLFCLPSSPLFSSKRKMYTACRNSSFQLENVRKAVGVPVKTVTQECVRREDMCRLQSRSCTLSPCMIKVQKKSHRCKSQWPRLRTRIWKMRVYRNDGISLLSFQAVQTCLK